MANIDKTALYNIGYGLYVVTMSENGKDNGMICNTVMQVTGEPAFIAVAINKANYSHDVIRRTGTMNVNILDESAPFDVFKTFGFQSGRDADKFSGVAFTRSDNGLPVLGANCNAVLSLKVETYTELSTHGLFICSITEARKLSALPTMTYAYYQANVKQKPAAKKKGYVCKICGYVYEGDELPADFVCPLCKHPASDFEKISDDAPQAAPAPKAKAAGSSKKYVCGVCGYTYDPAVGDPERGIPAGTPFEDLPADWECPLCSIGKDEFKPEPQAAAGGASQKYVCGVCGYTYDPEVGDPEHGIPAGTPFEDLPDDWECPLCSIGKAEFKAAE